VIVAWFDTRPVASLTVYGIGVGSPVKPACGVKVTLPLGAAVQVPRPLPPASSAGPRAPDSGPPCSHQVVVRIGIVARGAQRHRPGGLASELSLFATGGCWL